jgi:FKBP-type peptidyl-prolyl cis-trans isomerase
MRILTLILGALMLVACTKDRNKPAGAGAAAGSAGPASAPAASGNQLVPGKAPSADQSASDKDLPAPPDVAAPPSDAEKTKTGIASKVLQKGTGTEHPEPQDEVTVHYTGWTVDGHMFDSSVKRGSPATFGLRNVIKGWTEGLQLMVVGEKRRLWIPVELAYNHQHGRPEGMLVFDVELLSIQKGKKPVPAPPDVAAAPAGAQKAADGLATKVLGPGKGTKHPADTDVVTFDATGWNASDGSMIMSTEQAGMPVSRRIKELPPGIGEALKLMVEGESRRVWVPANLMAMRPGQQSPSPLTFDLKLTTITTPLAADAPEFKAPSDVAAAPSSAQKTASGLASKVLKKGTGTAHPAATDRVRVQYTGWQTDGTMFDSSLKTGRPAEFALNQVIPGWTEAVQLMVVGEKRRFWIPQDLAYKGQEGGPKGMLVFDIELLEIVRPQKK